MHTSKYEIVGAADQPILLAELTQFGTQIKHRNLSAVSDDAIAAPPRHALKSDDEKVRGQYAFAWGGHINCTALKSGEATF